MSRYEKYLASSDWERVKAAYAKKHPRVCARCGTDWNVQLHHKTYKHIYRELRHLGDLEWLCLEHHKETHGLVEPTTKSGWRKRKRREAQRVRAEDHARHMRDSKGRFAKKQELSEAEKRREQVIGQLTGGGIFFSDEKIPPSPSEGVRAE